jgi:hypothetical protein
MIAEFEACALLLTRYAWRVILPRLKAVVLAIQK